MADIRSLSSVPPGTPWDSGLFYFTFPKSLASRSCFVYSLSQQFSWQNRHLLTVFLASYFLQSFLAVDSSTFHVKLTPFVLFALRFCVDDPECRGFGPVRLQFEELDDEIVPPPLNHRKE